MGFSQGLLQNLKCCEKENVGKKDDGQALTEKRRMSNDIVRYVHQVDDDPRKTTTKKS